jgi:hypothetical protein
VLQAKAAAAQALDAPVPKAAWQRGGSALPRTIRTRLMARTTK